MSRPAEARALNDAAVEVVLSTAVHLAFASSDHPNLDLWCEKLATAFVQVKTVPKNVKPLFDAAQRLSQSVAGHRSECLNQLRREVDRYYQIASARKVERLSRMLNDAQVA